MNRLDFSSVMAVIRHYISPDHGMNQGELLEYHIAKDIAPNSRLHSLFTTQKGEQAYETDHLRIQHGQRLHRAAI